MARCFGEKVLGVCDILYVEKCDKANCSFFKTTEQFNADVKKSAARCKKLNIPSGNDYVIWKMAQEKLDAQVEKDYNIWKIQQEKSKNK